MDTYKIHIRFVLVLLASALLFAGTAWAQLPIPSQPVLIVQNSGSPDPYQNFVSELLLTEGINEFQTAQLSDLTSTFLASYEAVILPHFALTSAQATLFQNYVSAGGTLVGFRPDLQLSAVFGVSSLSGTLPESWLRINSTQYTSALAGQPMRFHGTADLYNLQSASALAVLCSSVSTCTSSPAAAINGFGQGQAILFSFDLTQSVVLMRQGNPAWAGYPNNHDGFGTMRPSQMFMDVSTNSFWNDLGDGGLNDIPQADIQLRLFSNILVLANSARPLPRLWYFPNQARALLLMTGDQHGDAETNSTSEVSTVQSFGGQFSNFLWFPYGSLSNATVTGWLASGNAVGIHFDDTAETDSSGIGGSQVTWSGMQTVLTNATASFAATFPSATAPVTTRDHFLIWASNGSNGTPDQTAQAKLFQNAGIQLDTTFSSFPKRWGYMTGSGLPMRFLDTQSGALIPVYEQATQYEDDIQLLSAGYSLSWDLATASAHYLQSLSDSENKYNTVVTMLFHPDEWLANNHSAFATPVLQYAQSHQIPMPSTASWLSFWSARSATAFSSRTFASNTLNFTAAGAPNGLTFLVPLSSANSAVSAVSVDGTAQSYSVLAFQGLSYAAVNLSAGTHAISVTYAPSGRILGQISPQLAAASTSIQVQAGSLPLTVQPAADGSYATPPLPPATYTVTPASPAYNFTPASQAVTLGSVNMSGINFTGTVHAIIETIFTTQTPVVNNASDGPTTNYELGTVFTSAVTGNITAIRFWKSGSESGPHTGNVWSSTGQLLASATFANETASGWQQQNLTAPLAIAANTQYVVSVNTGNTFYVATNSGLASVNTNLDLSTVVGNNGLFGSPGIFPTGTFQNINYFRDVVFSPAGAPVGPQILGQVTPSAAAGSTSIRIQGGSTDITVQPAADGTYSSGTLSAGVYSVTPTSASYTYSPIFESVTVGTANVTGVNFAGTAQAISETIFTTQVPSLTAASDGATTNYELGTVFTSAVAGNITAIRFWKSGSESGTHTGNLWSSSGQLLAAATFTNETASGWQQQRLSVPLAIAANTQYVVSVNTGNTFYVATNSGLASVITNLDLSTVVGNNGLFGSPGVFPTGTFQNTNYFRDVVFTPLVNETIFTTQAPALTAASDGSTTNYELGTVFTSAVAGNIIAIRFWKSSSESGTHTGNVWSSTGQLLATATFANETASGWQQQALAAPLAIVANTQYVASVNTGNSFYVATNSGLASVITNLDLSTVVGNNGLFGSPGTFPANTYQNTNYFRDVVFTP